jgi:hypothetical protein
VPCHTNMTVSKEVLAVSAAKMAARNDPSKATCYYVDWLAGACMVGWSENDCTAATEIRVGSLSAFVVQDSWPATASSDDNHHAQTATNVCPPAPPSPPPPLSHLVCAARGVPEQGGLLQQAAVHGVVEHAGHTCPGRLRSA